MRSVVSPCGLWEIWVVGPDRYYEPVSECGPFRSERDALEAGSRLRDWLHLGVWSDALPADLLAAREGLRALGVDPARCEVWAVPQSPAVWPPPSPRLDRVRVAAN